MQVAFLIVWHSDDTTLFPPREDIVMALQSLSRMSSHLMYARVLSCLSGQCRKASCMDLLIDTFPIDGVSNLVASCYDFPGVVRTLFLIYSFIMERISLNANERDRILDIATEYLDSHADNLPLIEAYVLLVVHAYNGDLHFLSSPVARTLERALQFCDQSEVIRKWITTLLQGYYEELSPDAMLYSIRQSHMIFITLQDNPNDTVQVNRCIQILSIYCRNTQLRDAIITIDSMFILLSTLRKNAGAESDTFLQITKLLYSIVKDSTSDFVDEL